MNHGENFPAAIAISFSWPSNLNRGVAKMKKGVKIVAETRLTIHDLCKYIPIMWYCFAPNACPQRVSVALDMPSCNKKHKRKEFYQGIYL